MLRKSTKSLRRKRTNMIVSLLIILSMVSSVVLPAAASPVMEPASAGLDMERLEPYGADDGNIALSAKVEAPYANGGSVAANVKDGKLASGNTGTVWNTWGTPYGNPDNPLWIQYTWDQPQVVESMRVMWWIYTDSGVRWARDCTLQYLVNDEWVDYGPVGTDGNSANYTGDGGAEANKPWPAPKRWGTNTKWNVVTLDDTIITKGVRLSITAERNSGTAPGIGMSEWEVFGYVDPAVADLAEIQEDFLMELLNDVDLPTTGSNGSTITWSESTNPALGNDGKVTRPANGEPDATGQITATAVNGDYSAVKQFEFSVFAAMDDEKIAQTDLDAIDIGNVSNRTTNFTFPQQGRFGAVFTWDTENSQYLWKDGNVLRPPSGQGDATVKLTATATFGTASLTREWEVTIPAYPGAGRSIVSCEPLSIECPAGNAPKLPNFVKVLYSNGESEQRRVSWEGYTTAAQTAQAEYPVGHIYTLNGNVLGDNAITNGYQVTAEITVVDQENAVPSNDPLAETLPLNEVTLENDPDGEANRLTLNRDNQIEYILGVDVTRMLYNYRETFGLSTEGYAAPGGWDSRTTKLKGHGYGHYLSGLAFAYASGATEDEKTQLMSRMKRMTDEMREMQEMTFVKLPSEDRYREARDRYSTDAEVRAMTNVRLMDDATAPRDPSLFGYGYINAIQPEHLILIENYAPYDGNMDNYGVWAPYYSLHKQLAGLVDIYYALDGGSSDEQAVADKALAIAKDMGMWVWNRLHYCTKEGTRPDANSPGYRDSMWALYIAGEFGGVNETLARLSDIMKSQGNEDEAAKLLEASMCFDNNGASSDTGNIPFFSSLADNRDSIRTLHCNQHIPQIIGALWNFKGSNDAKYYNIAENFWDYIIGRYSFTIGGVGGNNSNEEKFAGTYNQIGVVNTNNSDKICETCAAYNMLKLTKDLNTYNPDDAKYMDYYERLLYNQIIGSIVPGSKSNQVSYGYSIYPNTTRKRSTGNATNPGNTCCSGSGTENHVKYQEAAYFTSADNQSFYVGLYMPTTAKWEEQDVTIHQSCVFPSQESTFTVTPGAGTGEFEMKFRVPYWATKDFDITLNGTSLAESYEPSSYVTTGVRAWTSDDTIEVTMPFGFNVDYLPGKCDSEWYGSLMNGPLVMAATDVKDLSRVELDSYLTTGDGTNVIMNAPDTMTGGTSGETPTRNVPSLSVNVIAGTEGGEASVKTFVPHYFAGLPAYTTYFYIPASDENAGVDKTPLFSKINEVTDRINSGMYTDESIEAINEVLVAAAAVYQSADTTADQLESTITSLEEAIANLEAVPVDISKLLEKLNEATALLETDYTPDSFAVLSSKITDAKAYKDGNVYTDQETADYIFEIDYAIKSLVLLDRASLDEALNSAKEKVNPQNTQEKKWDEHEYTVYTRKSWNNFKAIEADSKKVNDNNPKVPTQSEIDNAAEALNRAMDALLPFNLCDEREPLETAIEEAKAYKNDPKKYTDESFAALQSAIVIAEERVEYASLTFPERDGVINDLKKAIEGLNDESTEVVEEAKKAAIKAAEEAKEAADAANADAIKAKADADAAAGSAVTATTEAAKAAEEAVKAKTEADKAKTEADRAKTEADKALADAGKSETARLAAEAAQKKAEEAQVKAATAQTNVEAAQKKAEEAKGKAEAAQSAAETAKNEAKTAQTAAETAATAADKAKKAAETAKDDAVAAKAAAESARDTAVNAKNDAAAAKTAAESAKTIAEAAKAEAIAAKTAAEAAKAEAIAAKTAAESARADALAAKAAAEAAAKAAEESAAEAKKAKEEAERAATDAAQKKKDAEAARLAAEKAQSAAESAMKAAQAAQAAADKAIADARNNAKKDSNALTLVGRRAKIKSTKSTKGKIKVTLTKDKAATGYQIQYSLKKTFKGKPVTKTTKNTSYTLKGMKKKTYYVRARGYTTNSMGKKVYSKWSTVKTVKGK